MDENARSAGRPFPRVGRDDLELTVAIKSTISFTETTRAGKRLEQLPAGAKFPAPHRANDLLFHPSMNTRSALLLCAVVPLMLSLVPSGLAAANEPPPAD